MLIKGEEMERNKGSFNSDAVFTSVLVFLNYAFFLKWASAVQNINGKKNNKPEAGMYAQHRREGDKNDG